MHDSILFYSNGLPFFLGVGKSPVLHAGLPQRMPFTLAVGPDHLGYQKTYLDVQGKRAVVTMVPNPV